MALTKEAAIDPTQTFSTKEAEIKGSAKYLPGEIASLKIHNSAEIIEEERTDPRAADPAASKG